MISSPKRSDKILTFEHDRKAREEQYLVSAIVSTYGAERFMRGCLEDLEAQTIADRVEIIVIDTGSPQGEGAIVTEFQARYRNIRYIRTEQRETIYQAWNRGAAVAAGKYLTNANADDRHHPQAFALMVGALESDPAIALVYGDVAITKTENQTWESREISGFLKWPDFDRKHLFEVCYVGPQPMWRKRLHQRYGYFDPSFKSAGDYEFWLRLAARGEKFRHIPKVLGLYLESPSGVEHSNLQLCHRESDVARQRHWRWIWGRRPSPRGSYRVSSVGQRPLVSVVIPTKSRPGLLVDALQSIVDQEYPDWEAIVVNDGGESVEQAVMGIDSLGRIRYLEHFSSFGQAAARNTALRVAKGKIICYLDDDDRFLPNHLAVVVRAMQESGAYVVHTDSEQVTESIVQGKRVDIARTEPYRGALHSKEHLYVRNSIPNNTLAHRRECLLQAGFFDESQASHEDWELLLRFLQFFKFEHIPELTAQVRVRVDTDNVSRRQAARFVKDFLTIYNRYPSKDKGVLERRASFLKGLPGYDATLSFPKRMIKTGRGIFQTHVAWRFKS